jgi:rod shape-determining protein MreC
MLSQLDENSAIKAGDVILTSGRGFLYPKGIRIGTVTEVNDDKARLTKNAIIQPFVEFDKLEEVFIIVPKDKTNFTY